MLIAAMEWILTLFLTSLVVCAPGSSVEELIPNVTQKASTPIPPKVETNTLIPHHSSSFTPITSTTSTQILNIISNTKPNVTSGLSKTTPLPPTTLIGKVVTESPAKAEKPASSLSNNDWPTMERVSTSTSTRTSTTSRTTLPPRSETSPHTTTTPRGHHGKKELEENKDDDYMAINSKAPIDSSSTFRSISTIINHQIVDEPVSKSIDNITQIKAPTSKSSLLAGLIFGSLLSLALGFLIYKRLDSARRRREYRRMNDYLIDGMYNDM
ncbi:unnamed protein product [Lepeophtheirus salmonis]|uniref:(salmon louse) hypothetical protein n=1 Tax=Lepeophtheirus salmonis TaxID=72036 RepID=A0A7R8CR53_LEPSM|nr:unnamed protein product [Lepeophtheirus salmonis]CAF2901833.1 unnamed protein product [Lepeophtheirus salmonis]